MGENAASAVARLSPRIPGDLARGNGVAALGDSITQVNAQIGAGGGADNGIIGSGSWFVQSCMASGGRMRYVRNAGVSGNTTAQMLDRIEADVIAHRPDWCFVLGGTNDVGAAVPQATIRANLAAIYRRLRGARIQPILCTVTPRHASAANSEADKLNAWIRWYAQTRGYPLCDLEAAMMDPATGGWRSGYTDGDLHPNQTGTSALVAKVVADITPLFPPVTPYTGRTALTTGASVLTLGNFNGDANADGVADGWTGVNTATNATPSLVAEDGHVFGRWQQLDVAVSGIKYFERSASAGWSVGDRLAFSGKVSTIGAVDGALSISAELRFSNGDAPNRVYPIYQMINDVTDWVWYVEAVVPPNTTNLVVDLYVNAGTGVVRWGEVAVVNMTAQGMVE